MIVPLTIDRVTALFRDGVASIERIASGFDDDDWGLPACGRWTGTQTARHVLAVARWYHEWLDRAIAGDASPPFDPSEMERRNDDALVGIGGVPGPAAIAEFASAATAYIERTVEHWDRPFGYPYGSVTVGLHCGVAAAEWHLHAWDLSHASARRHRPDDPETLFVAAGMCVAAAQGGVGGALVRLLVPLGARRHPWPTILKRSGRNPTADAIERG